MNTVSTEYPDSVTLDIVQKLEAELDKSVYEFSLYDYIDPDALEQVVQSSSGDSELSITFRVDGYLVTVRDGEVDVEPL